jgi:hypothetical protein
MRGQTNVRLIRPTRMLLRSAHLASNAQPCAIQLWKATDGLHLLPQLEPTAMRHLHQRSLQEQADSGSAC